MTRSCRQKVWLLLGVMLQSSLLFSTATVSGNLKDLTGANVSTRTFVRFRLAGCSYQAKASGAALVTPYERDFTPAADGSLSGTLYRNDTEISCLDQLDTTWYEVTVYRDGKPQKPTPYRVAASSFNLNTAAPMTITNVPAARDAVVVNPTALQTINSHPLAFGAGASLSATYQGMVQPSGTYLRSNGSLFAPASSTQLASDIVSSPSLNGVAYWNSSALSTTPSGGAGTLCLVSTDGGVPAFSSCAGSASTAWSALSAPSANLALNMGQRTSTFSWGTGTGANALFVFDGTVGDGTAATLVVKGQTSVASIFQVRDSLNNLWLETGPNTSKASNSFTAPAFVSSSATPASFGVVRLAKGDTLNFKNEAGSADINGLSKNAFDEVVIGGIAGLKADAVVTPLLQPVGGTSLAIRTVHSGNNGPAITIQGGVPAAGFLGSVVSIIGGNASGMGGGGDASLSGGSGATGTVAFGGNVNLNGGNGGSTSGSGGSINITAGSALAGNSNGGNIVIKPGNRAGTGTPGIVKVQDAIDGTKVVQFAVSSLPTGTTATVGTAFTGTASLDYDLSGAGITCQDLTISVTGAADGEAVSIGVPNALASTSGVKFSAWVSAADTVTVRACDDTSGNPNPAAATVRAVVWKF